MPPKGHKWRKTIKKEEVRELLRLELTKRLPGVIEALVSRAQGVRYFVTRNQAGKFEIVTDPQMVQDAMNGVNGVIGEFYTDKPDVTAIREMLDRTVDRSKEQEQTVVLDVGVGYERLLLQGRQRAAKFKEISQGETIEVKAEKETIPES